MATRKDDLDFTEIPLVDESIERVADIQVNPVAGTDLNSGEIGIDLERLDMYTRPSESYILFEGRLTKADGTAYADDDAAALTNNGIMYLFSRISYYLGGQEIETIFNPGQATTMMGVLTYQDDFAKAYGLNQLWVKDSTSTASLVDNSGFAVRQSYLIRSPAPRGSFSAFIPLKHIFGFCDDYTKIVYGMKHQLALVRKSDDDAIFRANGVDAGKVTLSKVSWYLPNIRPALEEENKLMNTIQSKVTLPVAFRRRQCDTFAVPQNTTLDWKLSVKTSPDKPRYVLVGFQTNRSNNQEVNSAIFDHCNLLNAYVMVNSVKYPELDYNLSFPANRFSVLYRDAAVFPQKFYGMDRLIKQSGLSPNEFKGLYPILVFDISKQSERLKLSSVDIDLKCSFGAEIPAGTRAYAVVISDRLMTFQSDGNKMATVY